MKNDSAIKRSYKYMNINIQSVKEDTSAADTH
jgi:hypothetical protein